MNYFDSSQLIIAGDLNTNYNYIDNPGINANDNNLLEIYNRTSDFVINYYHK